jgi:hypothetical protein
MVFHAESAEFIIIPREKVDFIAETSSPHPHWSFRAIRFTISSTKSSRAAQARYILVLCGSHNRSDHDSG